MNEKKIELNLAGVPDDVILDEGVRRLKRLFHRKSGKDAGADTSFEIVMGYGEAYYIGVFRKTHFYRSQPNLKLLENLE